MEEDTCKEPFSACPMCFNHYDDDALKGHVVACIQNFEYRDAATENEKFLCFICNKDISHLDPQRRSEHMNRCLDKANEESEKEQDKNVRASVSEQEISENAGDIHVCPLCRKNFCDPKFLIKHLKLCSVKMKANAHQLLAAIELEKKHAEERKNIGLPAAVVPRSSSSVNGNQRKPKKGKTLKVPKTEKEAELQMAIALSLSAKEEEDKKREAEDPFHLLRSSSDDITVYQQLKPPDAHHKPGKTSKRMKKRLTHKIPELLLRTEEERQRLIQMCVASITAQVIPSGSKQKDSNASEQNVCSEERRICTKPSRLKTIAVKGCPLWSAASLPPGNKERYYVAKLRDYFSPSKAAPGNNLKRLSQIPGHQISHSFYDDSSNCATPATKDKAQNISSTQIMLDAAMDALEEDELICNENTIVNTQRRERFLVDGGGFFTDQEAANLQLHQSEEKRHVENMLTDFKNLVNNPEHRDVIVKVKNGEVLSAHKVFLAGRCSSLLKDLETSDDLSLPFLDWCHVSYSAAFAFLDFVYSAQCNYDDAIRSELICLALQYRFKDLVDYIQDSSEEEQDDCPDFLNTILESVWPEDNSKQCEADKNRNSKDDEELESAYMILTQRIQNQYNKTSSEGNSSKDSSELELSLEGKMLEDSPNSNKSVLSPATTDDTGRKTHSTEDKNVCDITCKNVFAESFNNSMSKREELTHSTPDIDSSVSAVPTNDSVSAIRSHTIDEYVNDIYAINVLSQSSYTSPCIPGDIGSLMDTTSVDPECIQISPSEESNLFSLSPKEKISTTTTSFYGSPTSSSVNNSQDVLVCDTPSSKCSSLSSIEDSSSSERTDVTMVENCKNEVCQSEKRKVACDFQNDKASTSNLRSPSPKTIDLSKDFEKQCESQSPASGKRKHVSICSPVPFKDKRVLKKLCFDADELQDDASFLYNNEKGATDISGFDNSPRIMPSDSGNAPQDANNDSVWDNFSDNEMWFQNEDYLLFETEHSFKSVKDRPPTPLPCSVKKKKPASTKRDRADSEKAALQSDCEPVNKITCDNGNFSINKSVCDNDNFDVNKDIYQEDGSGPSGNITPANFNKKPKKVATFAQVTPMPHYDEMVTPELTSALQKIGVRPLKRKPARVLLKHVYEETHPYVTDTEKEDSFIEERAQSTSSECIRNARSSPKHLLSSQLLKSSKSKDSNGNLEGSGNDGSSSSSDECQEESVLGSSTDSSPSKLCNTELSSKILQFILEDGKEECLYLLDYKPVNLKDFQLKLKNRGIKVSTNALMDFFDKQCIQFQLPRTEKYREKQKRRNQRFRNRIKNHKKKP